MTKIKNETKSHPFSLKKKKEKSLLYIQRN